jgi:hypothetical protein
MESIFAALIGLISAVALYRYLRQRNATPQQRVAAMLRQYDRFAREGLSEREALLRILLSRSGWQKLPPEFLGDLVNRLGSKEAALRFVSLAEDCGYTKDQLPAIVRHSPAGDRMERLACVLSRFGYQLQSDQQFKEAEFVQKLALALGPDCYFTNLPLATTYHRTGRCTDARPLFERGIAQLHTAGEKASASERFTLTDCFGDGVDATRLRALWLEMYDQCVKSTT